MDLLQVPFLFATSFAVVLAAAGGVWMSASRPSLVPPGPGRVLFGFGWLLLLIAETVHGAHFVEHELNEAAVVLRTGGYALLVGSMLLFRSASASVAAIALTTTSFMPSFLAVGAAWVAFRSRLSEGRWLALAFALFGGSEVLFGLGGTAESADALWVAARLMRAVAALAVGNWLWQALRNSIQLRFVAVLVLLSVLVMVVISSVMTQVFASNVRTDALQDAVREGEAQKLVMEEQRREAVQDAKQAAGAETIQRAVARRDPVLGQLAVSLEGPGGLFESADFLAFFAPAQGGASILAYSASAREGEAPQLTEVDATALAGTDVVISSIGGVQAASIDLIGENKIALIGAFPVQNPPGVDPVGSPIGIAGAVALGRVVDAVYLQGLKDRTGWDFSMLTREQVLATTLPASEGLLSPDLTRVFEDRGTVTDQQGFGEVDYFTAYVPLLRADGRTIGALAISEASEVVALTQQNVGRILFVLVLSAAALATVLSYLSGSRVTRPIRDLTQASERVRRGDLESMVEVTAEDEVGVLGRAFNEMTTSIRQLTGDLRQAAEEEFEIRSRLETILQSMTDGVIAVDAKGRVLTLNREAERILGVKARSASGKPISDLLQPTDRSGAVQELPIHRLERGSVDGVFIGGRAGGNGQMTPVAITSAPIEDEEGNVAGAVAVVRDLTSQLEVEKLKTQFLSNISHELRTPLTPIKGYADLMRRKPVPRKQAVGFLDNMLSAIQHLERIVDMLVDVSSLEAGRLTPHTIDMDLDKTTAAWVGKWKQEAPRHRFQRKGFTSLPKMKLDERLLPRAIDELIDNAVKFSPKGGSVSLSGQVEQARNGAVARISVTDQGKGLSKEQIAALFEDFVQADASATREFGGLGIGLSFVRRIAEVHGGRLEARPLRKGSQFSIVLPITGDTESLRKARTPSRKPTRKTITKKRKSR